MEEDHLNPKKNKKEKKVYTEKEYWDGLVPDDEFEEYLNKYGYEYTPLWDINKSKSINNGYSTQIKSI